MSEAVSFRTEVDIKAAFHEQLNIVAQEEGLDVAWPATSYEPVQGIDYIIPTLFPATNRPAAVGKDSANRVTGFYQIMIRTPATEGEGQANDIITKLYPKFKRGTVLKIGSDLRIRIESFQTIEMTDDQSDWHTSVVRASYRSDIMN